ncbi:MAG: hypothetical protein LBD30_05155 [Verrucomicrobiales bacterium]|jgi:hypothetical protein|nr:hypothetical protein [Verrucomicrobiales bacterium]
MKSLLHLLLMVSGASMLAAGEPTTDRVFQDYAPEYLEIRAVSVQTAADTGWFNNGKSRVKIQAEVTQVYRSASGLRTGQKIQIDFDRKNSTGFGDTQPTVPAEGAVTTAFLRKAGAIYLPAARQYTFAPLSQQQLNQLNPRRNPATSATTSAPTPPADTDLQPHSEDGEALPSR